MFLTPIVLAAYDIDLYGASVCTAFGEYCAQRQRILCRMPRLRGQPRTLTAMIQYLMRDQ